jgi:hypothetical protein
LQLWVHNRQLPYRTYILSLPVRPGAILPAILHDTCGRLARVARVSGMDSGGSGSGAAHEWLLVEGEAHLVGAHPDK